MTHINHNFKLNRTQEYLLSEFKEDLSDDRLADLKFLIQKFFTKYSNFNSGEISENINPVNDFFLNEVLNETSIQTANMYYKLVYNYPSSKNVSYWNEKEKEWRHYRTSINETKKDMENEIERISSEYKPILVNKEEHLKK